MFCAQPPLDDLSPAEIWIVSSWPAPPLLKTADAYMKGMILHKNTFRFMWDEKKLEPQYFGSGNIVHIQ